MACLVCSHCDEIIGVRYLVLVDGGTLEQILPACFLPRREKRRRGLECADMIPCSIQHAWFALRVMKIIGVWYLVLVDEALILPTLFLPQREKRNRDIGQRSGKETLE